MSYKGWFSKRGYAEGLPEIVTGTITGLTDIAVAMWGAVTFDCGSTITGRGMCYATHIHPDLTDTVVAIGVAVGHFGASVHTLTPETTYYYRAYATNAQGTAYGGNMTFTTLAS